MKTTDESFTASVSASVTAPVKATRTSKADRAKALMNGTAIGKAEAMRMLKVELRTRIPAMFDELATVLVSNGASQSDIESVIGRVQADVIVSALK